MRGLFDFYVPICKMRLWITAIDNYMWFDIIALQVTNLLLKTVPAVLQKLRKELLFFIYLAKITSWIRGPSPAGAGSRFVTQLLGFDSPSVHSQEPPSNAVFVFLF